MLTNSAQAATRLQVRAFAKEGAMERRYDAAQRRTLGYGLRSAALDGAFMGVNSTVATGEGGAAGVKCWGRGGVGGGGVG